MTLIELKHHFFFINKNNSNITVSFNKPQQKICIYIPGSKSITNRAITLAGMSSKPVKIIGFLFAEDTYWGLIALQKLGFKVECDFNATTVLITPPHYYTENRLPINIFLGKAGTLARFFPSVILNWQKTFTNAFPLTAILEGEEQLQNRPLSELLEALKNLGGKVSSAFLPVEILSSDLAGECEISGSTSSQFLSGLLLAGCGAKNKIKILRKENLVQPDYVKITLMMIEEFGGKVSHNSTLTEFDISPTEEITNENYIVEADTSTACYFICLAFLHNFNLKIKNIGGQTTQPDYQLVYLLQEMGATIAVSKNETTILKQLNFIPPKGMKKVDCSLFSDQSLTIGILALFADGPIEVTGIGHIRHHESNRISCLVKNLNSLGFEAYEKPEGFIVHPTQQNFAEITGIWESFHDHRLVMAGFILASFCPKLQISMPQAVEKTAPHFFELVKTLGFEITNCGEE